MPDPKKRKRKGERPDGLIQRSVQIGYHPDGRPLRKYFYGHTAAEAERKRDAFIADLKRGSSYSSSMTVEEWVRVYLDTYRTRINAAYIASDDVPYNRLVFRLGRMRMSDVHETDLQSALNDLSGMSFSTVEKYRQAIKRVFSKATKNKVIQDDPSQDLTLPNFNKGTHRALEPWEVQHILANWNDPDARCGLWVMLMLLCGLRRGEMMALEWDAIDLEARLLHVRQVAVILTNQTEIEQRAKTNAGLRTLPICQTLFDALSSVPEESRNGFVCLSAKGKPLTESSVSRGLEHFCTVLERILNGEPTSQPGRRSDLAQENPNRKRFSFSAHDLRHTFATSLYDAGVPVKAAQYFLGHADIRITLDLYTHLSRDREQEARNQTIKYLDNWLDDRVRNALNFSPDDP